MPFGNKDLFSPEDQGCTVALNKKRQKISYLADKTKAANTSYHRHRVTVSIFACRSDSFFSLRM